MNPSRTLIFCLCLVLPWVGRAQITPAPAFRNNMVLQRSQPGRPTLIFGEATPKHVITAFYLASKKPERERKLLNSADISDDGTWRLALDITDAKKYPSPFDLILTETQTKNIKKKVLQESCLTNLRAGDVWFLADPRDQGRRANQHDLDSVGDLRACARVRFLDLTGNEPIPGPRSQNGPQWEEYPMHNLSRFSALAMRLGPFLALSSDYVGVVLVSPTPMQAILGTPLAEKGGGWTTNLCAKWKDVVNSDLLKEQEFRWNVRLKAKRNGTIETNLPPITLYDLPVVYERSPALTNLPAPARFIYMGAIWPRPQHATNPVDAIERSR